MARIGVIGGGVSGLVCAWALAARHEVTLLEASSTVGGHARTLGGNVPAPLPPGVRLDTGVLLYERRNFPLAHRLFRRLGIEVRAVPGATAMCLDPQRSWLSPFGVRECGHRLWLSPRTALHLLPLRRQRRAFRARIAAATREELLERPVSAYLADDDLSVWLRLLLMYAWSTPFERTPELPAAMAVPMLADFLRAEQWTSVVGGTWRFVEALLQPLLGRVHTGAAVTRIERGATEVAVTVGDRVLAFDEIVLAAGPDRVLELLADPSSAERERFGPWAADEIQTVVHQDDGPWIRRGLEYRSEFDLFRTATGAHGYNACLNRIAGLGDGPPWYGLAYNLGDEIDPARVVWVQRHRVPRYTVAAVQRVDAIRAHNGSRRTWHVGAWLGDGLQEGAIRSALEAALALGAPDLLSAGAVLR